MLTNFFSESRKMELCNFKFTNTVRNDKSSTLLSPENDKNGMLNVLYTMMSDSNYIQFYVSTIFSRWLFFSLFLNILHHFRFYATRLFANGKQQQTDKSGWNGKSTQRTNSKQSSFEFTSNSKWNNSFYVKDLFWSDFVCACSLSGKWIISQFG